MTAYVKIQKRDGRSVDYDRSKIENAIAKANAEILEPKDKIGQSEIDSITNIIESKIINDTTVEDIQDMIEDELVKRNKYYLAKKYILYRNNRALMRKSNTTDQSILSLIKNQNKELDEENSNKNTKIASTQRDYIAGEVSRDIARRILLPEHISHAHDNGVLHFHDIDYFIQPIFNCCLINIGDMLDNGTVMNGKMIESPKSFQVACTILTQVIAAVASNQYGGQSVDMIHLGKYLRRSRDKYTKEMRESTDRVFDEDTIKTIVDMRLRDELKAGVQTIQYQINTLMTTNGQSPFVTMFLHLDDNDEYIEENAQIVEEILRQRHQGLKNSIGVYTTPAFPKLIYVLDENNCLKGGKYDYITKLAVKCSSKRMYPDYISAKKMKENYEGNVFSCMGCVDGDTSYIDYIYDEVRYVETFAQAWDRLSQDLTVKNQSKTSDINKYMNTSDVLVWDNVEHAYVVMYRMIRNVQSLWRKITFSNGRVLDATEDHPFEVVGKGVVQCRNIIIGDEVICEALLDITVEHDENLPETMETCEVVSIELYETEKYSYDVTTETEHFTVNGLYSHNCRSFLSPWKDENGEYKFEGRFNQGVVSINLPQIGIIADEDEDVFWKLIDERLELCFEALMIRHKALLGTKSDISPIHWQNGAITRLKPGETIDKLLVGGYSTLSLGYIGLYETTFAMKGCSHTTPEGEEFALRVMNHLRETTDRWKKETGLGFALYGTPAESLCYRFASIDKDKFGTIANITDKGYYTNSYHIDVRETIDAFSKFKFESQFQTISSGGAISYVEVPNMEHNIEAMEECVKYIYNNIQYAEFNTKSDCCHVCGLNGEIKLNDDNEWYCPQCGNKDHSKMNVERRTCG